ncbi:MAG: FliH/SctL family protein [Brevinema sp.]
MEFQSVPFDPHARVLKQGQYIIRADNNVVVPTRSFNSQEDEEQTVTQRIDQMKAEISAYEAQLEERKRQDLEKNERHLSQVRDEAKKVMEDAEQHAFDRIQKSVTEKENILRESRLEADKIISQAQSESDDMIALARKEADKLKKEAEAEGMDLGRTEGYETATNDIKLVIERLHSVVAETARERERILLHSEQQVINLVLTMVNKVVKKLAIEHKEVVIENTKAALSLLRGAMTLFIRVSPRDYNLAASYKDEFIHLIEARADLKFIEDPTIEPGGVYIESDTGDIDATINTQLEELERQMRFYVPIKPKVPKSPEATPQTEEKTMAEDLPPTDFAQNQGSYGNDIPEEMRYTAPSDENTSESPQSDTVIEPTPLDTRAADVIEPIIIGDTPKDDNSSVS